MGVPSETPSDTGRGFVMLPEDVFKLTGQEVHPEVFSVEPTGNIIHVLVEEEPKEYGNLVIPDTVRNAERMGCGYIIAAGPLAGDPRHGQSLAGAVGVVRDDPSLVLGLHVIFAAHVGAPLRVSMLDREFRAAVLIMTTKDIRGVDNNPEPLTKRAERRSKE